MTPPYESKLLGVTNYYSWRMREKPIFMCYRLPQWLVLHVPPVGDFLCPKPDKIGKIGNPIPVPQFRCRELTWKIFAYIMNKLWTMPGYSGF